MGRQEPENGHVIEPVPINDIFVSGLHSVEDAGGGCLRITCFTYHTSIIDGSREKVVSLRFVVPRKAVAPAVIAVSKAIGWHIAGEFVGAHER